MNDLTDIQTRFPALSDGWARFDGPAGTQVVDTAIDAMSDWQRSGRNANSHGAFPAAQACEIYASLPQLIDTPPDTFLSQLSKLSDDANCPN